MAKVSKGYIKTLPVTSNAGGQLKQGEHRSPKIWTSFGRPQHETLQVIAKNYSWLLLFVSAIKSRQ
ncbi:hypothetical protein [Litoreibacter ascidiaceicola]|uniref:hypothetical protein n=1 Tax=Litoreibacter ascidiaceicola TaxID=1486859 RepID=UPI001C31765F|nr:hypothetical protein [Litoreibacter ascidiaceicola]